MINVLYAAIVLGALIAVRTKWKNSDKSSIIHGSGDTPLSRSTPGPSFGVVFVTVLKAIVALVVIAVVVMVGLLLIDQHVHSLT